jgi:hypothetical protein
MGIINLEDMMQWKFYDNFETFDEKAIEGFRAMQRNLRVDTP